MNINTGVQDFNLADRVTVRFNPTDMVFIDRLKTAMDNCVAREEALQDELKGNDDVMVMLKASSAADADLAQYINELFGLDVVTPLCEGVSVRAWADGMPIWANILMAILEVVDASQADQLKASQKRIEKYTKKYHR